MLVCARFFGAYLVLLAAQPFRNRSFPPPPPCADLPPPARSDAAARIYTWGSADLQPCLQTPT